MNTWGIIQFFLNLALVSAGIAIYVRSRRPRKDDPRLSKGLQLLQSKIAILEDLSDRVDNQVRQLTSILDQKTKMVHESSDLIQKHLNQVECAIQKSLEVSQIFQDKIPHKEIIERQNTIKYVKAARLANQGASLEEISREVDVPLSELEFIIKVNKDRLMFSEKDLPPWALEYSQSSSEQDAGIKSSFVTRDMTQAYEGIVLDQHVGEEDRKISNTFRESVRSQASQEEGDNLSSEDAIPLSFSTDSMEILEEESKSESVQAYTPTSFDTPEEVFSQKSSSLLKKAETILEKNLGFGSQSLEPQDEREAEKIFEQNLSVDSKTSRTSDKKSSKSRYVTELD